jgi:hypothetical protein
LISTISFTSTINFIIFFHQLTTFLARFDLDGLREVPRFCTQTHTLAALYFRIEKRSFVESPFFARANVYHFLCRHARRFTPHCSQLNVTEKVRWSLDLRFQKTGTPTGRHFWCVTTCSSCCSVFLQQSLAQFSVKRSFCIDCGRNHSQISPTWFPARSAFYTLRVSIGCLNEAFHVLLFSTTLNHMVVRCVKLRVNRQAGVCGAVAKRPIFSAKRL